MKSSVALKKVISSILVVVTSFSFLACGKSEPKTIEGKLQQEKNVLIIDYADFGPPLFTGDYLGKPFPAEGIKKARANGWDVGNIKVVVSNSSFFEAQYKILKEKGVLKDEFDYRFIWQPDALILLENHILANNKIDDKEKEVTRKTLELIKSTMGEFDASKYMALHDELEAWRRENMAPGEVDELRVKLNKARQK